MEYWMQVIVLEFWIRISFELCQDKLTTTAEEEAVHSSEGL